MHWTAVYIPIREDPRAYSRIRHAKIWTFFWFDEDGWSVECMQRGVRHIFETQPYLWVEGFYSYTHPSREASTPLEEVEESILEAEAKHGWVLLDGYPK